MCTLTCNVSQGKSAAKLDISSEGGCEKRSPITEELMDKRLKKTNTIEIEKNTQRDFRNKSVANNQIFSFCIEGRQTQICTFSGVTKHKLVNLEHFNNDFKKTFYQYQYYNILLNSMVIGVSEILILYIGILNCNNICINIAGLFDVVKLTSPKSQ
jgi:hypothetical protein